MHERFLIDTSKTPWSKSVRRRGPKYSVCTISADHVCDKQCAVCDKQGTRVCDKQAAA